jgi:hypothetical protein
MRIAALESRLQVFKVRRERKLIAGSAVKYYFRSVSALTPPSTSARADRHLEPPIRHRRENYLSDVLTCVRVRGLLAALSACERAQILRPPGSQLFTAPRR